MRTEHLVLTRFSLRYNQRAAHYSGQSPYMKINPLAPKNIRFRLVLLESVTLPSLVSQTSTNFQWIIMTESDLPGWALKRLRKLIKPYPHFHIHFMSDDEELGYNDWMAPYIDPETKLLLTTHLDDDDALHRNFIDDFQSHAVKAFSESTCPVHILGTMNVIEWDMDFNNDFPYGTTSKWHRKQFRAVSCGFTVAAKYPEIRIQELSLLHSLMFTYFDLDYERLQDHPNVPWVRGELEKSYLVLGLSADDVYRTPFHDMSQRTASVLMTNHRRNMQVNRLHESKDTYQAVDHNHKFGENVVDWAVIDANRKYFENVPGWKQELKVKPPLKQYLILKWAIRDLLRGKSPRHRPRPGGRPMRPRTREEMQRIRTQEEE